MLICDTALLLMYKNLIYEPLVKLIEILIQKDGPYLQQTFLEERTVV